MSPKIVGLIPARYASSRFPGKPLALLCGKPMIRHTYERAKRAVCLSGLMIATDDERIAAAARDFGAQVVMTGSHHPSGTDRIAEAALLLDADIVVNIQGDEPLITSEAIETVVRPLVEDPELPMSTLAHRIRTPEHLYNPHMGKVVFDTRGMALYFSRAPLPYPTEPVLDPKQLVETAYYNTVGLYGYRRDFLLTFAALPPTPLERAERLEQLRALEHGYRIRVMETDYAPLGVDVEEDMVDAENRLAQESLP
ncbi:MAG: 3-deoxy-manno-octulosonate cytidylyltransferase [candidate division Zixibacteria bacterium]|nr:3-deoxy-manno-octulosonate cytidylyltransferase [candidate division Zixibacteria bacterium]